MASTLLALLSSQSPVKTRRGLILTGLQNDFLSPDGKLPISNASGFLDHLSELVKEFREHGDIIWVRSHFKENRAVNEDDDSGDAVVIGSTTSQSQNSPRSTTPVRTNPSSDDEPDDEHPPSPPKKARLSFDAPVAPTSAQDESKADAEDASAEPDEELFLTRTPNREPCCIPGSFGADYPEQVKPLVDPQGDLQLIKTYYSAFASTSLLITLRAKLVTELYICGCTTNLSLFATAVDAARHGIAVTLVEDCLGYRRKDRHDKAIKQLREIMGARLMSSKDVIRSLVDQETESEDDESASEDSEVAVGEDASGVVVDDAWPVNSEDEDDEDLLSANVRLTRLDSRPLPIRDAFGESAGLRAIASKPESWAPTEPRQPSHTRAANAGSSSGAIEHSANTTDRRHASSGRHENHFDGWIGRATARRRSVEEPTDESSKTVIQPSPTGWKVINEEWADNIMALRRPQTQCKHTGLSAISALVGLDQKTVDEYEGMMAQARQEHVDGSASTHVSKPLFGDDNEEASAGSRIHYDLLPPELASTIFEKLNEEMKWQKMLHQTGEVPRLVCCQGTVCEDGSVPVYRHPSDQTIPIETWTPTVEQIKRAAEEAVGHPLNHALIQLYRSGNDYISEHSDKTLDIVSDSNIVNVSFGAQRTMRLRTKRNAASPTTATNPPSTTRSTYRIPMPHNSMITMTLPTNAAYLHGINADKRPLVELTASETAYAGQRISLTFRHIGTFLDREGEYIWGQGATGKRKDDAGRVVNGDVGESERLVRAFGRENASSCVEWEGMYEGGFDVLHLK